MSVLHIYFMSVCWNVRTQCHFFLLFFIVIWCKLREMDTLPMEATLSKLFVSPSEKRVYCKRKECAPLPSEKGCTLKGKNVLPFEKGLLWNERMCFPSEKGCNLNGKNLLPFEKWCTLKGCTLNRKNVLLFWKGVYSKWKEFAPFWKVVYSKGVYSKRKECASLWKGVYSKQKECASLWKGVYSKRKECAPLLNRVLLWKENICSPLGSTFFHCRGVVEWGKAVVYLTLPGPSCSKRR